MAKHITAALVCAALAGCASQQIHVPPHTGSVAGWDRWKEPPLAVEIVWVRTGFFEIQRACGTNYSPLSVVPPTHAGSTRLPAQACAILEPERKRCTIYTPEYVSEAMVGHEVLHCFLGRTHE